MARVGGEATGEYRARITSGRAIRSEPDGPLRNRGGSNSGPSSWTKLELERIDPRFVEQSLAEDRHRRVVASAGVAAAVAASSIITNAAEDSCHHKEKSDLLQQVFSCHLLRLRHAEHKEKRRRDVGENAVAAAEFLGVASDVDELDEIGSVSGVG